LFQSGFHRLAFFWAIAVIVAWFFIFQAWWGTIAAVILCVPVGLIFSFLMPMLVGSLRQVSFLNDAAVTWSTIALGIAVVIVAFLALDGSAAWLVALCGASLVFGGISLLQLRMAADPTWPPR
jgi:hypothetical protein